MTPEMADRVRLAPESREHASDRVAEVRRMVEDARFDGRLIPEAQVFDRLDAKYKDLTEKTDDPTSHG